MTIEEGIYAHLAADPFIAGLVGSRIYPLILPQKPTLPAITYLRVSRNSVYVQEGQSGLARPRFQISCWALTFAAAKRLSDEVSRRLHIHGGNFGATSVDAAFNDGEQDFYEDDTKIYQCATDWLIWHAEF